MEAKKLNLPLLIGACFQLRAAPTPLGLTLLAQTREGYGNLSELITLARSRAVPAGARGLHRSAARLRTCAACPNAWPS